MYTCVVFLLTSGAIGRFDAGPVQRWAIASWAAQVENSSKGVDQIRQHAESLRPLVKTSLAREFLAEAAGLPSISPRTVYRHKESRKWYSSAAAEGLSEGEREALESKQLDESDYYNTKYGSPLAYVRAMEVLGEAGVKELKGRRLLDYGYGTVGHLRLLAAMGADVIGVDVDSYLTALYNDPKDQGAVRGRQGRDGRITLVDGSFPGDAAVKKSVGAGYELILSKNTLKNGYIHPSEPVDPRKLVQLEVDDATFVRTLFELLNPGGRVLIYNICPAPAKTREKYIPWADGRSPFPKEMWESAGFRILAFDQDDSPAVRAMGRALNWDQGEDAMDLDNDLFGIYTLVEKPAGK